MILLQLLKYFFRIWTWILLFNLGLNATVLAQVPFHEFRASFFGYESIDPNPTIWVNEVYYLTAQSPKLYADASVRKVLSSLKFRETVQALSCDTNWCKIRTQTQLEGFIPRTSLSNVWLRAAKSAGRLYVYRGSELVKSYFADFGTNVDAAFKTRRGTTTSTEQWITPEGLYYIAGRNENSEFYKALLISYPNMEHADRGLQNRIITPTQYQAIKMANAQFRLPPMNTPLGGMIEIHGNGTSRNMNWTRGCIALRNVFMDELWNFIPIGAPILIEP